MTDDISGTLAQFDLIDAGHKDLVVAGRLITPHLDTVLERFYDRATNDPVINGFFPNHETVDHARSGQKRHWEMLLSGEFSDAYLDSCARIGSVHFRIQLPFELYLSGYSRATSHIQQILIERASAMVSRRSKRKMGHLFGALARAFALDMKLVIDGYFHAQQEEQNKAFSYLTEGIGRMAERDFSLPIPDPATSDFPARFDPLRQSFNKSLASVREVVETIKSSVDKINGSTNEIASAAQDLATRTENQAATLEETSAAMEEITISQKSSVEATQQTEGMALDTRKSAEASGVIVRNAVEKMNEIASSSSQMFKIIGVIEDIAFQTNLLALNAGVEAARAGEAGRGFAVVAQEVRGLAQRASNSAKEIKDLISSSSQQVRDGVDLVTETGTALSDIVKSVETVAELVAGVTATSREQSTGFTEINLGVSQLDSVTQQNAAMVEEASAAILSVQNDIQHLASLVNTFQVTAGNARANAAEWPPAGAASNVVALARY